MTTYFTQPRLSTSQTSKTTLHPSKVKGNIPPFSKKEDFRKWCIDPQTNHYFYSLAEGLNPHLRVSGSNPVQFLHGFVGDYDGDVDISTPDKRDKVIKSIKSKSQPGWEPNWICMTYSGKVRLIWEFEAPFLLTEETLTNKFIDLLCRETKCQTIVPRGGWDACSKNLAMFWELGKDWEQLNPTPIDTMRLEVLFFECAKKTGTPKKGQVAIPMEVIQAEVDERYPGRWVGDFEVGRRGPLFWIDDGVDRVGCIIQEGGVWCYSTRAGKNFVSWAEIFGEKFVKDYREQQITDAIADTYYDGKKYYVKTAQDDWAAYTVEEMSRRLRLAGFSSNPKAKGTSASAIDEVLVYIQDHRRITGAAPFIYNYEELVDEGRNRYINTAAHLAPMQPAATWDTDKWPNLFEWFNQIMPTGDDGYSFHSLMSWLKHYYDGALAGQPRQGHTLILAGNPDMGKSLFAVYFLGKMFGGATDAGDYLMGNERFNQQLGESPVWVIDDNSSAGNSAQVRQFGEKIKKLTATPKITLRAMYCEPVQLTYRGRMIMTTNLDADALAVVPRMTDSIMDKLLILKLNDGYTPWFRGKDSYAIEQIVDEELPYFLCWLHEEYKIPKKLIDDGSSRFGFKPKHNTEIVNTAKSLHGASKTYALLKLWWRNLARRTEPWTGAELDLLIELGAYEELDPFVRKFHGNNMSFTRDLANLAANEGSGVEKRVEDGGLSYYTIDLSGIM